MTRNVGRSGRRATRRGYLQALLFSYPARFFKGCGKIRTRRNTASRYGWELIRTLLGPDVVPEATREKEHARQVFGGPISDQRYGSCGTAEREAFLCFCQNRIKMLRRQNDRTAPTSLARQKNDDFGIPPPLCLPAESCTLQKSWTSILRARPEVAPSPVTPGSSKRKETAWKGLDEDSTSYLDAVTRRNSVVSEGDVRKMLTDEMFKAEVDEIVSLHEAFRVIHDRHNKRFSFECDDDGDVAEIRHATLPRTVRIPMSQLSNGYSSPTLTSDTRAFLCSFCAHKSCEEEVMQAHVARRHYLRWLSSEGFSK
ncbi:hypothetical protein RvY_17969 [Ramazzottius varieornatus]|uniref:Uncharacterized protein n=1 Tax=Ramazzottius varieornatus TaxID=947166 RepID=A0A1D1W424_RAMVA|nr:hypothetical protein RvY_17969 [Ramazzottius varieornatus]